MTNPTDSALTLKIKHATRLATEANDTLRAYMLSDFNDARTFDALILRAGSTRAAVKALLRVETIYAEADAESAALSGRPVAEVTAEADDYMNGDLKGSVDPYSDDCNPDSPRLNWQA